jgi:hypothetical protein
VVTLHGFFNLSTWLTAIAGAAILLLAYHLVTSRGSTRSGRGRQVPPEVGTAVHRQSQPNEPYERCYP